MTQDTFHELVHLVMDSPARPPETLFMGGMDDWHARARLAHFLAMQGIENLPQRVEVMDVRVDAVKRFIEQQIVG